MGLRCLLGHDFGTPELRRTREEQGDEVIISVNEIETCRRCGATRTVSENKEITSIEQLASTAAGGASASATDFPESTSGPPATGSSATRSQRSAQPPSEPVSTPDLGDGQPTEDAEILPNEPVSSPSEVDPQSEPADAETAPQPADTQSDAPTSSPSPDEPSLLERAESTIGDDEGSTADEAAEPSTEDAEILPNEPEAERQPGAWPEYETPADESAGESPTPWPEQTAEDAGYDAATPTDPEDLTGGGGFVPDIADAEADLVGGAPEEAAVPDAAAGGGSELADSAADAQPDADAEVLDDTEGTGFTRAAADDFEVVAERVPTEFYCPDCGLVRQSGISSMRAGDICPDCKRGYIAERPVEP